MHKKLFLLSLISLSSSITQAAPYEFDTPNTHVIVIRPVDSWSADTTSAKNTLELVEDKKIAYYYFDENNKRYIGTPAVFSGVSDHPIIKSTYDQLEKINAGYAHHGQDPFTVNKPVSLNPDQLPFFIEAQNNSYKNLVINQGNPADLQSKTDRNKFLGSIAAVAVTALTLGEFGLQGANASLQSGITNDVYHLTSDQRDGIAQVIPLEKHDFSGYSQIEIRKITTAYKERVGQIIVAYKIPKTPELEKEALVPAIIAASGIQETVEDVNKARLYDLSMRQAIWNDCVTTGNCKNK